MPQARAGDIKRLLRQEVEQLVVEVKRVGVGLAEVMQAVEAQWARLDSFCRETHNLLMHQDVRRIQGSRIVAGSGFSEGRRVRPLFGNSG